jgi:hypothetical protein
MENELIKHDENQVSIIQDANSARAIQEVQGQILVAQKCKRDENNAALAIANACKRVSLAEKAMYAFPRGGQMVTGPSIRLAEVIARCWGNINYGIREVSNKFGETKYIAFAWDMENNVRSEREFTQQHARWTKKEGLKKVDDPRDIYEVVASQATRRLRACILQVIPADIVEDAVTRCEKTLKTGSDMPLQDRAKQMIIAFSEMGVTQVMLEERLQHKLDAINEVELLSLRKIYTSIKDGVSDRNNWFNVISETKNKLNERFNEKEGEPK